MQHIFSRYERKFLLNEQQKNLVISFLNKKLIYDIYVKEGKPYGIYNYYFDTKDYDVIRHSVSKPPYKEKVRLRFYESETTEATQVFLEVKKKAFSKVNKRRIPLTMQNAKSYLVNKNNPVFIDYLGNQIFKELDYLINTTKISPTTYIEYKRLAYIDENSDLRITIDQDLNFMRVNEKLESITNKTLLIPKEFYLMEIKSSDNFPLWLVRFLSEESLFSQSFSKYGRAYQHYLQGGFIDELALYKF